ncbi:MAG: 3-phosphoshikimate 1-carboxyvinyltransferase [Deltaproteobacteria bacterium CG12_big_fil_rev_8_21_14_0_65_43_10]|nr:MAG: 3-phosphoshikimate 1-carboxyvinyltransferase [Deltaproteobacteria bacterium CG2_30_43_15]PIQ45888.1 MAG: 3-phosphoshikimate 1-carboxyvinyltransferase [Deltaproteobacteria bacterium CG12_big_fil_rev_8_21_14_0_65_43_10]PIU85366.1 MAG: 3-phosphoshikimate 1-carboxyvinyltransferase [Deltaproteobacteria bacterium CG06_land_8_20_14_3_00_44_19]PIX22072.1 MAG: 3-phosphoshikimate 1-carboxyvinyltransferase [Deltaproteobacteria bacterium CG_4_8_14_3_um_filter_43_13]PIZ19477.1 MAG: 3-phosphoshikimat
MEKTVIERKGGLKGEVTVPGDKSISHRAVIIGSLAKGKTRIIEPSRGDDNLRTLNAFRMMGIEVDEPKVDQLIINGRGLYGLTEPEDVIDAGNSGTTVRLLTGLLTGQRFFSVITGDRYLRKRPMKRVVEPLSSMGAKIWGRENGNFAPLAINGTRLNPIDYVSPIASAQVKSAILLAGLYADGVTKITEPSLSRDHTERMLRFFGANLKRKDNSVSIAGGSNLEGRELEIPGDISSAAFFIVAALIIPNSEVFLKRVGVNPSRTGILEVLKKMGANIQLLNEYETWGEPVADILVKTSRLKGTKIDGDLIPKTIDELPILSLAASVAEGDTVIKDAKELRVKETDRIKAVASELKKFGAEVEEFDDGMRISGKDKLMGCNCQSFGDHRIAMSLIIAGLMASGKTVVEDTSCIGTSFPEFRDKLFSLIQ